MKNTITNIIFLQKKLNSENVSKIANQQPTHHSLPTTSQKKFNNTYKYPKSSTIHTHFFPGQSIYFQRRNARLSGTLEPVVRQAPLSEPQYEPTYSINPCVQQDLNRVRHISQNQNTLEIKRQIIHPRRKRNSQTPRAHFNIPQPPTPNPLDLSSSPLPDTPPTASQQSTSNIPWDYLGSTPTSEPIRENPFNPPATTERLPFWAMHTYTQGETNLVSDPIDFSSDTTLSALPETFSLPSTPSLSQISPTLFPLNFSTHLDSKYQEQSSNNIPLRLNWVIHS